MKGDYYMRVSKKIKKINSKKRNIKKNTKKRERERESGGMRERERETDCKTQKNLFTQKEK